MAKAVNFDATILDTTVGTSETTIAHELDRTPQEAFIISRGASANVFRGSTVWNSTNIFLTASASVAVSIVVF